MTGVDDSDVDGDQDYAIRFTVTSTDSDYNGITVATVPVTNVDDEVLPLSLDTIAGDDGVNIAEKAAGFAISGAIGSVGGVSVTVTVGMQELTATSAGDGSWTVDVPADASYIAGTSVEVSVNASKDGFRDAAEVTDTLAVDLVAPSAPTYTAPASLKVGVAITAMSPSGGSGIDIYAATGLPSGLVIDGSSGDISGTPDAANASTATATVTVSDAAGNTDSVEIAFPAVAKGDQTLSGFAYGAGTATLGSAAPAITPPAGARTTPIYSADPATVCTVEASTGALTLVGAGSCVITVTAPADDDWNVATASFTVTVRATNTAPTTSNGTVSTNEDTAYTFEAGDFAFSDADTGDALASVKITRLPETGKGTLALDGTAVTANQVVAKADLDAGKLKYTPPANANGDGYADFEFTVSDGTAESAPATTTIDVIPVNDAPTASDRTVTTDEDTAYTFEAGDFGFADVDPGDALASVTITQLPETRARARWPSTARR